MTFNLAACRRVFITGVTSGIVKALLGRDELGHCEIIGLTRQPILDEAGIALPANVRLIQGDLGDPDSYRDALAGIDLVIHAAALTHSRMPDLYHQVNYLGTRALVELSAEAGVQRFVFISSRAAVVGAGAYGETKRQAEQIVRETIDDHVIVRPAEVFGTSRGEGIEKLIRDAIQSSVLCYPLGVPSPLYPIHVDDVIGELLAVLHTEHPKERTVELVGDTAYSYPGLIKAVGRWTGRRHLLVPLPRKLIELATGALNLAGLELGPVPDQVARLYAPKNTVGARTVPLVMPLRTYVAGLVSRQSA